MFSDTVLIILLHAMEVGYLYLWLGYAVRTYAICRVVCMFSKKFRFARNAQTTIYFVNQQFHFIQVRPGIEFASGFVPPCLRSENKWETMGWIRNGLGHSSSRRFSLWLRWVPIWYHITLKNDTIWTQTARTLQARRQQSAAAVASKTSIDCPDGIGTLCIPRWLRDLSRGFTSCVLFLPVQLSKRSTGSEPIVLHIYRYI